MAFTLSTKTISSCALLFTGKWIIPRRTVGSEFVNKDFFYSRVAAAGKLLVNPSIGARANQLLGYLSQPVAIYMADEAGSNSTFCINTPILFFHTEIPNMSAFIDHQEDSQHIKSSGAFQAKPYNVLVLSLTPSAAVGRLIPPEDACRTVYGGMTDNVTLFEGLDNDKYLSSSICSQLDCWQCETDKKMTLFKMQTSF